MIEIEALLSSLSETSTIPVPVLRAVWLREVTSTPLAGDVSLQCQRRVREFVQKGPRSIDADLWPSSVAPVTAPVTSLAASAYPNDKNGKKIDTLGMEVTVVLASAAPMSGAVVRIDGEDVIVNVNGSNHRIAASELCT